MRNDIFAHVPEEEMTLEQLSFRYNGRLHDIQDARLTGDRDVQVKAHQAHLSTLEILHKKIRRANNG